MWEKIKTIASEVAKISGLNVAGVDIVLNVKEQIMVLEVNGRPGLEIQNINERSLLEDILLASTLIYPVSSNR